MNDAFKELLKGMNDHEINALDSSTLDDEAREALLIEVANRNRANEKGVKLKKPSPAAPRSNKAILRRGNL